MHSKIFTAGVRTALAAIGVAVLSGLSVFAESKTDTKGLLESIPVGFVQNVGQVHDNLRQQAHDVLFTSSIGSTTIFLRSDGITYVVPDRQSGIPTIEPQLRRFDVNFEGANANPLVEGQGNASSTETIYYAGRSYTPSMYSGVRYNNVYENIDVVFYPSEGGVKFDWIVRPGGDPSDIALRYDNVSDESNSSSLRAFAGSAVLQETIPATWQEKSSGGLTVKAEVKAEYKVDGNTVRYAVGAYDKTSTLVIDPRLMWAEAFGTTPFLFRDGPGLDTELKDVIVAPDGYIYAIGSTRSVDFPQRGSFVILSPDWNIIVLRFTEDRIYDYSMRIGGSSEDRGEAIDIDPNGKLYIAGWTRSNDMFTTPGAFQTSFAGMTDAWLGTVNTSSFGTVAYGTYFGGSQEDYALDVAASYINAGRAAFTGWTAGTIPIVDPWFSVQPYNAGGTDMWVCSFFSGVPSTSTHWGGMYDDKAYGVTLDINNNVAVCGSSVEDDFPVWGTNAIATTPSGTGTVVQPCAVEFGFGLSTTNWTTYFSTTPVGGEAFAIDKFGRDSYGVPLKDAYFVAGYVGSTSKMMALWGLDRTLALPPAWIPLSLGLDPMVQSCANDMRIFGSGTSYQMLLSGWSTAVGSSPKRQIQENPVGNRLGYVVMLNAATLMTNWTSNYGSQSDNTAYTELHGVAKSSRNNYLIVGHADAADIPLLNNEMTPYNTSNNGVIMEVNDKSRFPTYFGGKKTSGTAWSNGDDEINDVVTDNSGNMYIVGTTKSESSTLSNFPLLNGGLMSPPETTGPKVNAFVAKFDQEGNLEWSTLWGGAGADEGLGIALSNDYSTVYIVGRTSSATLSTWSRGTTLYGSYSSTDNSGDAFISAISSTGGTVHWTRYVGSDKNDLFRKVAVDSEDKIVAVGESRSSGLMSGDFTSSGAYKESRSFSTGDNTDALVGRFNPNGTKDWVTLYGGDYDDGGTNLAIDSYDNIILTGYSCYPSSVQHAIPPYSGKQLLASHQMLNIYPASTFSTVPAAHITTDALVWSFTTTGTTGSLRFSMSLGGDNLEDIATAVVVDVGGTSFPYSIGDSIGTASIGVGDAYYIVGYTNTGESYYTGHTFPAGGDGFAWTPTAPGQRKDIFLLRMWERYSYPSSQFEVASRVLQFPRNDAASAYSDDVATDVAIEGSDVQITGYSKNPTFHEVSAFYHSGLNTDNPNLSATVGFVMQADRGLRVRRLGTFTSKTFAYLAMDYTPANNFTRISAMALDSYSRWLFVGNSEGSVNCNWEGFGILDEDLFQPNNPDNDRTDGVIFRTDYDYSFSARQVPPTDNDILETGDRLVADQPISVNLYPNPAADHLTISMAGGVREDLGYAVVDMAGKVLLSGTLASPQLMLPVGHLPTGAYLLVLTRATGATVSMSWIKQ